ncbi:MAG: tRNA (cytidine(34)-2'-O)-methyltransferase [Defluviitaleaceae bacterium]|nr:tRNA (cytidine(34)-2'-O)-methyltransferase [Defluviitaleaceae bacterium]
MNIVLFEPEIPHNTGAIGRTCLVTGTGLHLIRPLGFFLDEKSLKRAGMDYWPQINAREYDNFEHFMVENPKIRFHLVETGGVKTYAQAEFQSGDFFIFGSESKGLPPRLLKKYPDRVISIPMKGERSLNLSVSVGIVLYEALRQNDFFCLSRE